MALENVFEVEIIDKDLITVNFHVIDRTPGLLYLTEMADTLIDNPQDGDAIVYNAITGKWENKIINVGAIDPALFIQGEVPTPSPPVLSTAKYTTANNFETGTLEIFLNGLKLLPSDVTIYPPNQFSIAIDTISQDVVTVNYIKQ